MVYALTYRRPAYVSSSRASIESEKSTARGSVSSSTNSSCPYGIPDALSFDKIINGGTCPPCTTREFMDFLVYIEHDAENLQFYLWYRDYLNRFSDIPVLQKALAPEWTPEKADAQMTATQKENNSRKLHANAAAVFQGTDFDSKSKVVVTEAGINGHDPFNTPPPTPLGGTRDRRSLSTTGTGMPFSESDSTLRSIATTYNKKAAGAFESAQAMQPFTVQPYREEITRVIAIYIADGAARQLNLSSKERSALLKALSVTTHPSAFRDVVGTVEWSLRHQAHPNFIRWTICNGNQMRQLFAKELGITGILGGFVCAIVLTLSSAGRGWRVMSAFGFVVGFATLIAAWKGMCVVLHGLHHRHLRPWELFVGEDDASSDFELKKGCFDSLGCNNSHEDEPWIAKYEKRNFIRKIFDREVWIQEPALRQIQDTIFLQAVVSSFAISAVLVAVFVAIPRGQCF